MANYITPLGYAAAPPTPAPEPIEGIVLGLEVDGEVIYPNEEGIVKLPDTPLPPEPPAPIELQVINYLGEHVLESSDIGNHLRIASSSPVSFIIPSDLMLSVRVGAKLYVEQAGSGKVYFVAAGTLLARGSKLLNTAEQYAVVTLIKVAPEEWLAYNGLESKDQPGPGPDPEPTEGLLTDTDGNQLTDSLGNYLVYEGDIDPSPVGNSLVDSQGNSLVDSSGNSLVPGEEGLPESTYLTAPNGDHLTDSDANKLIKE